MLIIPASQTGMTYAHKYKNNKTVCFDKPLVLRSLPVHFY